MKALNTRRRKILRSTRNYYRGIIPNRNLFHHIIYSQKYSYTISDYRFEYYFLWQ